MADPYTTANIGGSIVSGLAGLGGGSGKTSRAKAERWLRQGTYGGREELAPLQDLGMGALGEYIGALSPETDIYGRFKGRGRGMPNKFRDNRRGMPGRFDAADTPGKFNFNLTRDPGYRFARDEALRAVKREMGAAGYNRSGNLLNELAARSAGLASQYANDAFNRQAGAYGLNMDRSNIQHGRAMDEFGANRARSGDIYNRRMGANRFNLDRSNTLFGRDVTAHNLNAARNQDQYAREQNYLSRLAALGDIGVGATTQAANMRANMGTNVANIRMGGAAQIQANDRYKLESLNNAIQGGLRNHLLQQYLNPETGGRRPSAAPPPYYQPGGAGPY